MNQKFFEVNVTKMPLIQPTDTFADIQGVPDICGERAYRFLYYYALMVEVPWMVIDTVNKEYWMDVQDEMIGPMERVELVVLEVTLVDWPDVTPVFMFVDILIECPDFHSSLQVLVEKPTTGVYDVTEAALQ